MSYTSRIRVKTQTEHYVSGDAGEDLRITLPGQGAGKVNVISQVGISMDVNDLSQYGVSYFELYDAGALVMRHQLHTGLFRWIPFDPPIQNAIPNQSYEIVVVIPAGVSGFLTCKAWAATQ